MMHGCDGTVLPRIQQIFHGGTVAGMSDSDLLDRFIARHDEAAFEALLTRHGPLVLGVCRALLRDPADVADAFQATFLILVRQARSIHVEETLGPWIYGVATRVAIRARSTTLRREGRERPTADLDPAAPHRDLDRHDVSPILHEELARLPERLRKPIVLCYLEGLTHDQAAERLQWPVGTVRSRLARARDLLRTRLTRRGVALSACTLVGFSRETLAASLPRALSKTTLCAAMRIAAGRAAISGTLSVSAAALMEGVLRAMWLTKLKVAGAAAIAAGVLVSGVFALAGQNPGVEVSEPTPVPRSTKASSAPKRSSDSTSARTYYVGDLILPTAPGPSDTLGDDAARVGERPRVDFSPLIALIDTTIAPGTWKIHDPSGADNSVEYGLEGSPNPTAPVGSITPFFLSLSLIIRHTPEVHEQVEVRLLQLRRLIANRNSPHLARPDTPVPKAPEADPHKSSPKGEAEDRGKIQSLEKELSKLRREHEDLRGRLKGILDPPDASYPAPLEKKPTAESGPTSFFNFSIGSSY